MRSSILAAAVVVLTASACEKAEDKAANADGPPKFDIQYCATGSIDSPTHMPADGCLASPNRSHVLVMQPSGALELAAVTPAGEIGTVIWSSDSKGSAPRSTAADLQEDGNLVIYQGDKPIWNSHTPGPHGRYSLTVTDSGNAILKDSTGKPLWAADFDVSLCRETLDSPTQLPVPGCIVSPNKHFVMEMVNSGAVQVLPIRADGTLGASIWSSGNHASSRAKAPFMALQSDGNFVVYIGEKPVWNAGTNGAVGTVHLDLSDEGELKLHRADGAVIWSSKTGKVKA